MTAARMQQRRDTTAGWEAADPVLLPGEIAYNTTTGGIRVGNGTDPWSALPDIEGSLPAGGVASDVLTKLSGTDGDADWVAPDYPTGIPDGGTTAQVLAKASNADGDVAWVAAPEPANSAAAVTYAGSTNLSAANVEAALDELDAEKAPLAHTHAEGDVTGLTAALAGKVATTTSGLRIDRGTSLPAAGNAGRLFIVVP